MPYLGNIAGGEPILAEENALDVFNRIKNYNAQEVNFWINQVLSDL